MAGARAKRVERLGQQRRGAGHEQAHGAAGLARERGRGEKPRVERRHAHHHRRARQCFEHRADLELRQPQHACTRQQRTVQRDEQAVHVIDRQRVQQRVAAGEAPAVDQHRGVRREIAVRQHRALGAPGRSRRVEDRREIVGPGHRVAEVRGLVARPVDELAAVGVQREHRRVAGERRDHAEALGPADDHPRRRIGEEVRELRLLVADVERKVDEARAQAREVERNHLPVLVDLDGNAIPGLAARTGQRVGDLRRQRREIVEVHDRPAGDQQARLLRRAREVTLDQRVQVGVHRKAAHAVGSDRRAARAQPDVRLRPDYSTCDPITPARHLPELLALDASLRQ